MKETHIGSDKTGGQIVGNRNRELSGYSSLVIPRDGSVNDILRDGNSRSYMIVAAALSRVFADKSEGVQNDQSAGQSRANGGGGGGGGTGASSLSRGGVGTGTGTGTGTGVSSAATSGEDPGGGGGVGGPGGSWQQQQQQQQQQGYTPAIASVVGGLTQLPLTGGDAGKGLSSGWNTALAAAHSAATVRKRANMRKQQNQNVRPPRALYFLTLKNPIRKFCIQVAEYKYPFVHFL
ncbi:voltage-dependent l-type calcium channel subunit alpha [Plakobranchus ocellatus]|uniref:Voltage-dependent l-type calcium channel subunit alpha n=1 Tax=Plakobranchus ocellatus TaxID=259542 RepID=A0AAV4A4Y2_9GAST|nr:voltage-dependent l-type calcium channel subunit alpha [Plakobranchus ocellatus]